MALASHPPSDGASDGEPSGAPTLHIPTRRVRPGELPFPRYMTSGAAGADLTADIDGSILLQPGARCLIPTGLAMAIPHGFEAQIRPRSGLAFRHGVTVLNSPGTIDSDYRGEVKVLLINHGEAPFEVTRGERIAQVVIAAVVQAQFTQAESLDETERGAGGYGHTGRGGV